MRGRRFVWAWSMAAITWGCAGEDAPQWVGTLATDTRTHPAPSPSVDIPQRGVASRPSPSVPLVSVEADGRPYPLRATGLGSLAELGRDLARLQDAGQKALYRQAFVKTFYHTREPGARPHYEAVVDARRLAELNPRFAPAWRCLGNAWLHLTGELEPSIRLHRKAIEIDPAYAEAHYMLALLLGMAGRPDDGAKHFRQADALHLPDVYGLGRRFYAATRPTTRRRSPRTD